MDQTTWLALTVILTVLGLAWTFVAFRRRGPVNALRALGFTLLPAAAYLTGTLTMFTEIVGSIGRWATSLVFDPMVWTGIALAGAGVGFVLLAAYLRDRQLGKAKELKEAESNPSGSTRNIGTTGAVGTPAPARTAKPRKSSGDTETDDVEEMLRKRGIE